MIKASGTSSRHIQSLSEQVLEEFKKNGDIKKGDEIISSGLGGRFPEGFLLGRVSEIKENDQSNFLQITVENTFDFSFGSTILFTKP